MLVKQTIKDFINKNLVIFDEDVQFSDDDNIFEKGFVNSLFAMKLLRFVESEFDLIVEPDDMNIENFSSINNIANLIASKQLANAGE